MNRSQQLMSALNSQRHTREVRNARSLTAVRGMIRDAIPGIRRWRVEALLPLAIDAINAQGTRNLHLADRTVRDALAAAGERVVPLPPIPQLTQQQLDWVLSQLPQGGVF